MTHRMRKVSYRVLVFAKAPVAGRVKSRLLPFLGAEKAARLHTHLVQHALETAVRSNVGCVELWCTPSVDHPFFVQCAKRFGVRLRRQIGRDLGERMSHAFQTTLEKGRVALLMGTDCPSLRTEDLRQAKEVLDQGIPAVLSPAEDGGYVLIGLRKHDGSLFDGIPWGTDGVLRETRSSLRRLGWEWRELASRWDVDRPEDVESLRLSEWGFLLDGG